MKRITVKRIETQRYVSPSVGEITHILYIGQTISDYEIEVRQLAYKKSPEGTACEHFEFPVTVVIDFGDCEFERDVNLNLPTRYREIIKKKSHYVHFRISREDWELEINRLVRDLPKEFYLTEDELLDCAQDLMNDEYEVRNFRGQVEVAGCVADGLAFIEKDGKPSKIIGFEAKTDRDNYSRLYRQVGSYLTICDEVYLIIEEKEPPADLPFYVGVISCAGGKTKCTRRAQSLKHNYEDDFWSTLHECARKHVGLKKRQYLPEFFDAVESMKRKLIWNQFVIGFSQSWKAEYLDFNTREKRAAKAYFAEESL